MGFLDRLFGKQSAEITPQAAARAETRVTAAACPGCALVLWPPSERVRSCPWCGAEIVLLDLSDRAPRDGDLVAAENRNGEMLLRRYRLRENRPALLDAKGKATDSADVKFVVDTAGRPYR